MSISFGLKRNKTTVTQELIAGLTTFSSMAYVLIVNPMILSTAGMNLGATLVATILTTFFATALMGLLSNLPIAIAPGMGSSAFLTFSIVLSMGRSWQEGLAAVFISATVLGFLNVLGLRAKIIDAIPLSLIKAITSAIGLFLICVALKELNILSLHPKALFISLHSPLNFEVLLALIGFSIIAALLALRVKCAFIVGILAVWILSLFFGLTSCSKPFSLPPSITPTLGIVDFSHWKDLIFWKATFSLFLVMLFDSSAALVTLKRLLPYEVKTAKEQLALYPDAVGSMAGAFLGTGSLAIHLESASGIHVGGRTGLTSVVVALLFLLTLFIYPVIASVPTFASSPVLFFIGLLMLKNLKSIRWDKFSDVLPTLIILFVMPITFSIYYGFAVGFIAFAVIKVLAGRVKEVPAICWILSLLFLCQFALTIF